MMISLSTLYAPVLESKDAELLYQLNGLVKLLHVKSYLQKQMQETKDWKESVYYLFGSTAVQNFIDSILMTISTAR